MLKPPLCHLEAQGSVQVVEAGERFVQDRTEAGFSRCGCCTMVLHRVHRY